MTNKYLAINFIIFGSIVYLYINLHIISNKIYSIFNMDLYYLSLILISIGYFFCFSAINNRSPQSINWFVAVGILGMTLQNTASLLLLNRFYFINYGIILYISLYSAISLLIWGLQLLNKKNIPKWAAIGYFIIPLSFTNLMYYLLRYINYVYFDYYFQIHNQIWFILLISFCYMLPSLGLLYDIWKNRVVIHKR